VCAVKVSVLCAVKDEEQYLATMIDSLLGQTLVEWELLLVDDGSLDGTRQIAQEHADRDQRIKLVSSGVSLGKVAAYNLAFSHSAGEAVVLLAGDDSLPRDSLMLRYSAFASHAHSANGRVLVTGKLRTFSEDDDFDGLVLPRGSGTSTSGGVICMSRALAECIFPIPNELPSEDIWLGEGSNGLADIRVDLPDIVLNYRIHPGNSNPRHLPFAEMSRFMAARFEAFRLLAECSELELPYARRRFLSEMYQAELNRRDGKPLRILARRELPLPPRLSMVSMSLPALWLIRSRFYRLFSGHQVR